MQKAKNLLLSAAAVLLYFMFATAAEAGSGSAGCLRGRVLLVSVFADNPRYKWTDSAQDAEARYMLLDKVKIAAEYIENECEKYGTNVTFIYDWSENSDLIYKGFCSSAAKEYEPKQALVKRLVNEQGLKGKYKADNVVYLYFVNTDASYTGTNFTHRYRPGKNGSMPEIAVLHKIRPTKKGPCFLLPSSVAHEILHAFGAHDLYRATKQIPQGYVNYLKTNNIKDIMGNTNYGDTINAPITAVTAYYLGLISEPPEVARFNLAPAEK